MENVLIRSPQLTEFYCFYDELARKEPEITLRLQKVVSKTEGVLVGLDQVLKNPESFFAKINRFQKNWKEVTDIIRYTYIAPDRNPSEDIKNLMKELKNEDFIIIKYDNKFKLPQKETHYRGIHLDMITPGGNLAELQIHTKESYRIKTEVHPYYKIMQNPACSAKERKKAVNIQRKAFDQLPSFFIKEEITCIS